MTRSDSVRTLGFVLISPLGLWLSLSVTSSPSLAGGKVTAAHALEFLQTCPDRVSERRHKRFEESLDLLSAEHLDQVLLVAKEEGPVSCRAVALLAAGMIATKIPDLGGKVVAAISPHLSHPDLWQAAIQAIVPIGAPANEHLMRILDTSDKAAWEAVVVILQNINYPKLGKDSVLMSAEFPDTPEGRAEVSASWRQWWQGTKGSAAPGPP